MNRLFMKFRRNDDGAVMIEFALIAPMLFLMIFGILELGLIMLSMSTIESATNIVTRTARIGNSGTEGDDLVTHIRKEIKRKTFGLINSQDVIITTESEINGQPPLAEECYMDDQPPGQCPGVAHVDYDDVNNNNNYDYPATNLGQGGDVVAINVFYIYNVLTPGLATILGDENGEYVVKSSTVVVNE